MIHLVSRANPIEDLIITRLCNMCQCIVKARQLPSVRELSARNSKHRGVKCSIEALWKRLVGGTASEESMHQVIRFLDRAGRSCELNVQRIPVVGDQAPRTRRNATYLEAKISKQWLREVVLKLCRGSEQGIID